MVSRNGMYGKRHSKEALKRMRKAARLRDPNTRAKAVVGVGLPGGTNPNAKPVLVDGIEYGCIKEAAQSLGCNAEVLRRKFRHFRKTNVWPTGWADLTMET